MAQALGCGPVRAGVGLGSSGLRPPFLPFLYLDMFASRLGFIRVNIPRAKGFRDSGSLPSSAYSIMAVKISSLMSFGRSMIAS